LNKKKNGKKLIGWDVFICIDASSDTRNLSLRPYRVEHAIFKDNVIWFYIKGNLGEHIYVDSKFFRKRHRATRHK
jgi:hypothetical protein